MTDEKNTPKTTTVVMTVESHNVPRGTKVKVDTETAERLIANQQAREV